MAEGHPVIVVGSGASGTLAAYRLLSEGFRVHLLDGGQPLGESQDSVPPLVWEELRRRDGDQHRYLLGEDLTGVDLGGTGPLAQITPPRREVFLRAAEWLRTRGEGLTAVESLAPGGLSEAWGAVSFPFTARELTGCGLDPDEMARPYEEVASLVGISGSDDDLAIWRGPLQALQPALPPDANAAAMLARYVRVRRRLHACGLRMGRSLLAVLSAPLAGRSPNPGYGTEFFGNAGGSVYRPSLLLRSLRELDRFSMRSDALVTRFREGPDDSIEVDAFDLRTREPSTLKARRLVLAAGALGTARIVLRSLGRYGTTLPLTCNEHTYVPSIRVAGVGAPASRGHALAQLTAMFDPTGDQSRLAQAQSYSTRGLPIARLLKESPLAYRESIRILSALATSFVVLVIQYEDRPSAQKWCRLQRGTTDVDDVLEMGYAVSTEEKASHRHADGAFRHLIRSLGCWPIRTVRPGAGSSVHYAGTLPVSRGDHPLTTTPEGRLRETRGVYVADGSGINYLPAKGPTLTLMANAFRIGGYVARSLRP